jgi:hypothetical protein
MTFQDSLDSSLAPSENEQLILVQSDASICPRPEVHSILLETLKIARMFRYGSLLEHFVTRHRSLNDDAPRTLKGSNTAARGLPPPDASSQTCHTLQRLTVQLKRAAG